MVKLPGELIHSFSLVVSVYRGAIKAFENEVHCLCVYEGTLHLGGDCVVIAFEVGGELPCVEVQVSACFTHTVPMRLHEHGKSLNHHLLHQPFPRRSLTGNLLEKNTQTFPVLIC